MIRYPHTISLIKSTTTKDDNGHPIVQETKTQIDADVQRTTLSVKGSGGALVLQKAFRVFFENEIDITGVTAIEYEGHKYTIILQTPENQINREVLCQA